MSSVDNVLYLLLLPFSYLRDDNVSERHGTAGDVGGGLEMEGTIVEYVVLDTVVDVRDLADVKPATLGLEVLHQFSPPVLQEWDGLIFVQLTCIVKGEGSTMRNVNTTNLE